jgi:hypothetical protein
MLSHNHTTDATRLTGALGVHRNQLPTSFFRFVGQQLPERAQGRVMRRQREVSVAGHKSQAVAPAAGTQAATWTRPADRGCKCDVNYRVSSPVASVLNPLTGGLTIGGQVTCRACQSILNCAAS